MCRKKTKVLLLSSVLPARRMAGELVLFRHIDSSKDVFEIDVFDPTNVCFSSSVFLRKLIGRFINVGRLRESIWAIWAGGWARKDVVRQIKNNEYDAILTVAHGDLFMLASRISKDYQIPLITIFHDWWPDLAGVAFGVKKSLEKKFIEAAEDSVLCLCVSDGMKATLGLKQAEVLLPMPGKIKGGVGSRIGVNTEYGPLKLAYSGNLSDSYGGMIGELNQRILTSFSSSISFTFSGSSSNVFCDGSKGFLGLLCDDEYFPFLLQQDMLLVVMSFEEVDRKRAETSFPSKLLEYCQTGRPVFIWGPEYCSAVKFAKTVGLLYCSDRSVETLILTLVSLKGAQDVLNKQSELSIRLAKSDFSPRVIQKRFVKLMEKSLGVND